ncbi:hypothetical protein CFC21_016245 [Triticum aestivum]|uniref:Uncharacterized protein n=3 Tax=Triticum TaxID=4564 RepID=A0A9R1NP63_TRITD|nr:hypothetical protein CFC21_016245 [Triticum aestivum]VAH28534.1 unnamed protein product [Triticum turgidum subsp. durum]
MAATPLRPTLEGCPGAAPQLALPKAEARPCTAPASLGKDGSSHEAATTSAHIEAPLSGGEPPPTAAPSAIAISETQIMVPERQVEGESQPMGNPSRPVEGKSLLTEVSLQPA